MRVRDLMTPNVHCCTTDQSASDAARAMWDFDIGCVPVVDGAHKPIAMVTDRDICMAAYTRGQAPSQLAIEHVMSRELFTCQASDSLASAERTMKERQVRRLPVVDEDGKLVGILSLNDLVLAGTRSPLAAVKQRLRGDVSETLAAVSRRRPRPVGAQL